MNEAAAGYEIERNHVDVYDPSFGQSELYPQSPQTLYHSEYSSQQQQGAFGGGAVFPETYSGNPYGGQAQSAGYLDEYGQFVTFYQARYPNQYYNGGWGQRGGRGKRGRGRGRGRGGLSQKPSFQHYSNRPEDYQLLSSEGEASVKPKQFSYQGNRYRHDRQNRKKSTSQTEEEREGSRSENEPSNSKDNSVKNNSDLSESALSHDGAAFYPESAREAEVEAENTYAKKSVKTDKGYSAQRRQRGGMEEHSVVRPRSGHYTKYGKARGGYTYNKKNGPESAKSNVDKERQSERQECKEQDDRRSMVPLKGRGGGQRKKGEASNEEIQPRASDKHKADSSEKPKNRNYRGKKFVFKGDQDDETQRSVLIEQLSSGGYECMVCFDVIRRDAAIWGCNNCYHVFHLRCIKKWARTPASSAEGQTGWRCPACQNLCPQVPNQYRCFCGKVKDPDNSRYDTPHSCGEICGRERNKECPHPCNILCHPGPCPVCQATITKHCSCGHFKMSVKCGQAPVIKCQRVCEKTLNCGRHECELVCHEGQCPPCEEKVKQVCYCGAKDREVVCGCAESFATNFSCQGTCNRVLECGFHRCESACHPAQCEACRLSPAVVRFCPCLKTPLSELEGGERQSCTDAVPTCTQVCDKELLCGPPDAPHKCVSLCHTGDCPECEGESEIVCRCGALSNTVPCKDLPKYTGENRFICDKRCNKKRDCGRHRCSQLCCVDSEHKCDLICGKKLSCGLHRCEELCHRGNCRTCWNVSFDELHCHCGNEVLYPPVACGTEPPECRRKCTRMHPCGHEVLHNCHSESVCPPCTQLTEKWCLGKHEYRKNIPCHITDVSCGLKCGQPLSCGQHKCIRTCHKGDCTTESHTCTQPCSKLREDCGHMCKAPCHPGKPCPKDTACREEVTLRCECGNRSEKVVCHSLSEERAEQEYQRMATSMLAMRVGEDGQSMDISSLMQGKDKQPRQKRLECSQECAIQERNRRLALALDIKNPDLSNKPGPPNYTDFLREVTKKQPNLVAGIEKALGELVLSAQKSAQKCRSHAFNPMNRDQRRVVHELAEYYGCTTQSYDEEPKKNVVATAYKDKCWRPSLSLTALVQRELHPKAPVPIPHRSSADQIRTTVQASKQSTQLVGSGSKMTNAWTSKSTQPLNSWTTLRPSKSGSERLGEQEEGRQSVSRSQSNTTLTRPAWGKSSSSATEVTSKKEPVIDYFEMTD